MLSALLNLLQAWIPTWLALQERQTLALERIAAALEVQAGTDEASLAREATPPKVEASIEYANQALLARMQLIEQRLLALTGSQPSEEEILAEYDREVAEAEHLGVS